MRVYSTPRRAIVALAVAGLMSGGLVACGGDDSGDSGSKKDAAEDLAPLIIGTTDKVTTIDPAGSYDLPSWTLQYNIFQNLLAIPAGGNTPTPDAAESCDFDNPTTYTCTLKDGLKFSDGSPLTSEDVKFSIDRVIAIADPNGPSSLFGSVASVEAPDEKTVTITLKAADATLPFVLTTGAGAIVSAAKYPADALHPDDQSLGSGLYKIDKFDKTQQVVLVPNENYSGDQELANSQTIVSYFQQESALKTALENKEVMVAYRSLSPTDVADIEENGADKGVAIVTGAGTEINYLVLQNAKGAFANKAVRQAAAQLIDREAIAENIYNGSVDPLYSMVPEGLTGHAEAFQERYGAPDKAKAQAILQEAGVTTPVKSTLWYTPSRYGATSADMYAEIQRQLNDSGLFDLGLESAEYEQYKEEYPAGTYPAWQLGWFPDFPDADNYLSPFYDSVNNFLQYGYKNAQVDTLLAAQKASTDPAEREAAFQEIQTLVAEDAPIIPIWQGKQIAGVVEGVEGVEDTFDPSFTFRFWLVKGVES